MAPSKQSLKAEGTSQDRALGHHLPDDALCFPSAPFCSLKVPSWAGHLRQEARTPRGLWCSEPGEGLTGTSSHGRLPGGAGLAEMDIQREVDTRTMVMVVACFHYSGNFVSSELWRIFLTLNSPPSKEAPRTGSVFLVPGITRGLYRLKGSQPWLHVKPPDFIHPDAQTPPQTN